MTLMTDTFNARHILVTGAARGIGKSIAEHFIKLGATVAVADTSLDSATSCVEFLTALGCGTAYPVHMNVADAAMVEDRIEKAAVQIGQPFDTLINNAGISPKHNGCSVPVWDMDPDEWRRVMDVNLTGCFNTIRYVVPMMRQRQQGWIVNMASIAAKIYSPIVSCHYSASKAGIIGLTRQLAGELGPDGIRVNAISPGRIATDMTDQIDEVALLEQIADTPMRRFGLAGEVAEMAIFLSSQASSFVTGQTIDVAGGYCMT